MLRECHRLLKPAASIAGYVIQTPRGLNSAARKRASDLGPPEVLAPESQASLNQRAGLTMILEEDVTDRFLETCQALLLARKTLEEKLRPLEGNETYEEELQKAESKMLGISEGLLRRSLIVARKQ